MAFEAFEGRAASIRSDKPIARLSGYVEIIFNKAAADIIKRYLRVEENENTNFFFTLFYDREAKTVGLHPANVETRGRVKILMGPSTLSITAQAFVKHYELTPGTVFDVEMHTMAPVIRLVARPDFEDEKEEDVE